MKEKEMREMNNQEKTSLRWTTGEIIVSKPLTTLALTAVLAFVLILKVLDPISTPLAKLLHISTRTTAESVFVITLLVLGVAVSAVLSVILLKLAYNLALSRMDPAEAAAWHAKSARPKWNIVYSLLLGYLLLVILASAGISLYSQWHKTIDPGSGSGLLLSLLACVVCGILPYIIAALSIKWINKGMVKLTRTNQELIEEIRAGQHNAKIPENYRNEEDIEGIIRVLNGAQASTVRGAVAIYWTKCTLVEMGKAIAKMSGVVAVVLGVIIVILTLGCVKVTDMWGNELQETVRADIAAAEARAEEERIAAKAAAEAEERRRKKWFTAKQADKKAQYDEYQARKATREHPNTYKTYSKVKYAQRSREEAKRLNREKYRD